VIGIRRKSGGAGRLRPITRILVLAFLILSGAIFPIALVEGFFQLNSRYKWLVSSQQKILSGSDNEISEPEAADWAYIQSKLSDGRIPVSDPFERIRGLGLRDQVVERTFFKHEIPGQKGVRAVAQLLPSQEALYDVDYHINEFDRRFDPSRRGAPDKFLLFLGCSFVFGEGLDYRHSLPGLLQDRLQNFHVYNLGVRGLGPNDYLAHFDRISHHQLVNSLLFEEIPEEDGVVVYNMLDFHIDRVTCPARCYLPVHEWIQAKPEYRIGGDGGLQYVGTFDERNEYLKMVMRLAAKSETLRFFNHQILRETHGNGLLVGSAFRKLKNEISQRFNVKRFLVILSQQEMKWIGSYLEAAGWEVSFADSNIVKKIVKNRSVIPFDGHPSPEANWVSAQLIAREIDMENDSPAR